jgi:ABC-type multidrug transport system ATPase subunit
MSAAVRFTDVVATRESVEWPGPVTFEVQPGELVLVTTLQAASTHLVRLLVGLRQPVAGTVEVLGTDPGRMGRWQARRFRARLGVAFHNPVGLVSNIDLETNLVVPQLYSGLRDRRAASAATAAVLDRLELHEWRGTRPADLPPEIRREAAVARALVRDPELLILEEPVDGLDERRSERLLGLCREHAETIIISSAEHDEVVLRAADRTVLIDG